MMRVRAESHAPRSPAWTSRMNPGSWYRVSGDAPDLGLSPTAPGTRYLGDNDPAQDPALNPARTVTERLRRVLGREPAAPWRGSAGFGAITEAWNSAVYASRFGDCGAMVVFGGGHADYYGSDMHAFDLASREWQRIVDGWVGGGPADYGDGAFYPDARYPDGSPLPPHTYDYVQYDPAANDYLLIKGQLELGKRVKAVAIPHMMSLTERRWRRGPQHPTAMLNSGGFTTWDAERRVLWGHAGDDGGGNAFVGFAPDGQNADGTFGVWRECHPNKLLGIANHNVMQMVPSLDLIVLASHARDALGSIDPACPDAPIAWLTSTGARPRIRAYAALAFAPRASSLVYFSPQDEGAVYGIDSEAGEKSRAIGSTWHWRRLDDAASLDPIDDAARVSRHRVNRSHCFGRFRIATFRDAEMAILIRHVDSPVYAMKLGQ